MPGATVVQAPCAFRGSFLPRSARAVAALAALSLPALPQAMEQGSVATAACPGAALADAGAIRVPFVRVPQVDTSTPPKQPLAPARSSAWGWASVVGTVVTGVLGYLHYFVRSLTPEERVSGALRRALTRPFRSEPYFPANRTFLKISSLNHAAVLGLGVVASLETGQSVLALSAPAVFLAGTLACLRVSVARPVNRWVRACEMLAIGAIGCLVATRVPQAADWLRSLTGVRPVVVGICAALLARTMAITPLVLDAFRALRERSSGGGFPPLKNLLFWNLASLSALFAVHDFQSLAAVIPLGYVLQNTVCLGLILACYARWRARCRGAC